MADIAELEISVGEKRGDIDATGAKLVDLNRKFNEAEAGSGRLRTGFDSTVSAAKGLATAVAAAGAAVAFYAQRVIAAGAGFEQAMSRSTSIMVGLTAEMEAALERQAIAVSDKLPQSARQAAEAYFFLASAGLDAQQSMAALEPSFLFATAGALDLALATDQLTDSQSALGLVSKDAARNQENMVRISDVLVKANTLANASVLQFAEALTSGAGAAMRLVNRDIEEGVAVIAAWADQGLKGAAAGERMNILLRDLLTASTKNREEFDRLGVSVLDSSGNLKNLADVVESIERVLDGASDAQKRMTLSTLGFQDRSVQAITSLVGYSQKIREWETALRDAAGTTADVATKQLDNLNDQLSILSGKFQNVAIEAYSRAAPGIRAVVAAGIEWVDVNREEIVGGVAGSLESIKNAGVAAAGVIRETSAEIREYKRAWDSLGGEEQDLLLALLGIGTSAAIGAKFGGPKGALVGAFAGLAAGAESANKAMRGIFERDISPTINAIDATVAGLVRGEIAAGSFADAFARLREEGIRANQIAKGALDPDTLTSREPPNQSFATDAQLKEAAAISEVAQASAKAADAARTRAIANEAAAEAGTRELAVSRELEVVEQRRKQLADFVAGLRQARLTPFQQYTENVKTLTAALDEGVITLGTYERELDALSVALAAAGQGPRDAQRQADARAAETEELIRQAQALRRSVRPAEELAAKMAEIRRIAGAAPLIITPEIESDAINRAALDLVRLGDEGRRQAELIADAFQRVGERVKRSILSALEGTRVTGRDLLRSVLIDIADVALDETIFRPLNEAIRSSIRDARTQRQADELKAAAVRLTPTTPAAPAPVNAPSRAVTVVAPPPSTQQRIEIRQAEAGVTQVTPAPVASMDAAAEGARGFADTVSGAAGKVARGMGNMLSDLAIGAREFVLGLGHAAGTLTALLLGGRSQSFGDALLGGLISGVTGGLFQAATGAFSPSPTEGSPATNKRIAEVGFFQTASAATAGAGFDPGATTQSVQPTGAPPIVNISLPPPSVHVDSTFARSTYGERDVFRPPAQPQQRPVAQQAGPPVVIQTNLSLQSIDPSRAGDVLMAAYPQFESRLQTSLQSGGRLTRTVEQVAGRR